MRFKTSQELADCIDYPSTYTKYFMNTDGEVCCGSCATKNKQQIVQEFEENTGYVNSPRIQYADFNFEDTSLYCDWCNERIAPDYVD